MKFGKVPVDEARGAILAHSVAVDGSKLRKAHILTADDVAILKSVGVDHVVIARLSPDDIGEDEAARRLAAALSAHNIEARAPSTGRVNLHAVAAGVFTVNRALVDAFNAVDPAITLATLADFTTVTANQMVATVKIIPFAVAESKLREAANAVVGGEVFRVITFRPHRVGLIQTHVPGMKPGVLDKTARLTAARLERSGSLIVREFRTAHDAAAVADALASIEQDSDLLIIFGASAVSDDEDVIPAAIRLAGGSVERTGMPVDPGNLLVLGSLLGKPVIGAPGCARSPKVNGFDWILDRLCAGMKITAQDIGGLGVGGLLMEIPTRPQPREIDAGSKTVGAVLLAAGRSSRMGGFNKLLADFDGKPLVRRSAERLLASKATPIVAVIGHQAPAISGLLGGLQIEMVENRDFAGGIAGSLKAGVGRLPPDLDGVLVALADMPGIETSGYDRMIDEFRSHGGGAVIRATAGGKRGNPVILPRALLQRIDEIEGDTGARYLIETAGVEIVDVELGEAARLDVDTPVSLAAAGGTIAG